MFDTESLFDKLPTQDEIRTALAVHMTYASVLKKLLRVVKDIDKERERLRGMLARCRDEERGM